jgi:hypothetical protein
MRVVRSNEIRELDPFWNEWNDEESQKASPIDESRAKECGTQRQRVPHPLQNENRKGLIG